MLCLCSSTSIISEELAETVSAVPTKAQPVVHEEQTETVVVIYILADCLIQPLFDNFNVLHVSMFGVLN